jgi:hypothetical protein
LNIELDKNGVVRIKDAFLNEYFTAEEKVESSETETKSVNK